VHSRADAFPRSRMRKEAANNRKNDGKRMLQQLLWHCMIFGHVTSPKPELCECGRSRVLSYGVFWRTARELDLS